MGTTGGDREKLIQDTIDSGTYAVIAPQMGKQVIFNVCLWYLKALILDGWRGA